MELTSLLFITMFLALFYFKFMRSSRFLDVSFVFIYKNLLRKNSKLNLLYLNKACDIEHPHLRPISIAFLAGILIDLLSMINFIISLCVVDLAINNLTKYVGISLFVLCILTLIFSLIFCEISNKISEKKFELYSQEELDKFKKEIESEWPDFFNKK